MNRSLVCLIAVVLACAAQRPAAAEVLGSSLGPELECTRQAAVPCVCPDDYCPRPQPCIGCPRLCWLPDDYCRPPTVCLPNFCISWCPDDYCPKPWPKFCWPTSREFYRCGPCAGAAPAARAAAEPAAETTTR